MALLRLFSNIYDISKRAIASAPITNDEIGLTQIGLGPVAETPEDREAIFPQWFFSSKLGQPRQVDTLKIRDLAQSPWVQMVLNTFKKQIYTTDWDIIPIDEDDNIDYTEDIKKVKDKLMHLNKNNQNINDVVSESITDIGEIDAGIWNMVYSGDSYTIGEVPIYNAWGKVINTELGLVLKPFGQRTLNTVKSVDGSTMLKQVDIHKNLLAYWQYSFKHPRQNPTRFQPEEIIYMMMNPRPYSVYGFSPVQSVQQAVELLIQGTRYNKDLYTNQAIPDYLVSLPKLPVDKLRKLKRAWNNEYKGRPHQMGFINWAVDKIQKLAESNRDLEWLEGQKWYFKLIFGVFGVSPTEAGFFENSNKSNDEGQERVTVRNALKPYFKLFENKINDRLIYEILQKEPGIKFKYFPKDHTVEKIEFEQNMQELELGVITINEYRKKQGKDTVAWGDDPLKKPFDPETSFSNSGEFGRNPGKPNNSNNPQESNNKSYHQHQKNSGCGCEIPLAKTLEIDAGDDIVEEATDYSDFLLRLFDSFEKKVLKAADSIKIDKSYIDKSFGAFLKDLFNTINTVAFSRHITRFITNDFKVGITSAETELDIDIGFKDSFNQRIAQLQQQQINGYSINGKPWPGIKGVTREIQQKIIANVQAGINENKTIDEIKSDIKDTFDNFSDWRAEMIARTETARIIGEGKLAGYKESGIKGKKLWNTALDNRTSDICKRLNGQKQELDDPFIDPETHKAFMTPPSHVNCRSTLSFRPDSI